MNQKHFLVYFSAVFVICLKYGTTTSMMTVFKLISEQPLYVSCPTEVKG